VDDHQTKNAEWLGRVGAAQVVSEAGLTAPELANRLATLFGNGHGRARLLTMAESARGLAVTDAARRVADLCLLAEGGRL
jgi:UDP-N-acetylglucosamine--N-acetylmuramyl-(pentapeptide) pyrophosphoryl-undecaprenol N-acetylglucosamine transferase